MKKKCILKIILIAVLSIVLINSNKIEILAKASNSNSADTTMLLARLINGEAEGESYKGKVAVGAVVLNRVKSSQFPNTISGVIYQKNQFSCVKDGNFNKKVTKDSDAYKAAKEALDGADPTGGALFFYNPKTTKSKWLFSLKTLVTIGNHRFAVSN